MLPFLYKSVRFFILCALLLAGGVDLFSVDLDQDGDVDTDAVLVLDSSFKASADSVRPSEQEKTAFLRWTFPSAQSFAALPVRPVLQDNKISALASLQLMVPLRT